MLSSHLIIRNQPEQGIWEMVEQLAQAPVPKEPWVRPEAFVGAVSKQESLLDALAAAPQENVVPLRESSAFITLPMPDGSFARFRIVESPVMAPALAAKFPRIKTYLGQGVDDPAASARLDWTPQGFHAQILSADGAVYIDPYWKGNTESYVNYYQRDGFMALGDNGGDSPNYYPNSFGGPEPKADVAEPPFEVSGQAARQPYTHPNDDFFQAGELYRRVMTDEDRDHLIGNITTHLCNAIKRIQMRQSAIFYKADPEYGTRVAEGLALDVSEVKRLAEMSQEERAKATAR